VGAAEVLGLVRPAELVAGSQVNQPI
jgi:hypothetical protein